MIPYGKQDINSEDIEAVINVLKSDFLTQGPQVPAEKCVAEQVQNMAVLPIVQLQHSILHVLQSVWEKVMSYGLVQIHL